MLEDSIKNNYELVLALYLLEYVKIKAPVSLTVNDCRLVHLYTCINAVGYLQTCLEYRLEQV